MNFTREQKIDLVKIAKKVRKRAYAPYSNYKVGAAVLTESGQIYKGVNVENAVYPDTICAERAAIFAAVGNGETKILAVAVVTKKGGTPCGSCRQVMSEFGTDILVIIADENENIIMEKKLSELLPNAAFISSDLE